MNHDKARSGFTLVELMLAMGFVSALLLAIVMTVIQIGSIYNRGITYKNVNQAGSTIANEIQRSIGSSYPFDVSIDGNGNGTNLVIKTWGGRLCTQQYSYIWNNGAAIKSGNVNYSNRNIYSIPSVENGEIHFIKVIDPNSYYCLNPNSPIVSNGAVELLKAGQYNLAIHRFSISSSASANDDNTHQRLYSIEFILGTNDTDSLNSDSSACKLPNEMNSDSTYCSINRFNLVARAGNSNTSEQ